MLKKLNPHSYSIVCAECGVRETVQVYCGMGTPEHIRLGLATDDLLHKHWTRIQNEQSLCPVCSGKADKTRLPL